MPVSGHGATWAIELPDVGGVIATPGVFTAVAEINSDIKKSRKRESTNVTPHDSDWGVFVTSSVRTLDAQQFTINMIYGRAGEAALQSLFQYNTVFGSRTRARDATTTDYWIVSGQITGLEETFPVRTGARSLMVTYQPSGAAIEV